MEDGLYLAQLIPEHEQTCEQCKNDQYNSSSNKHLLQNERLYILLSPKCFKVGKTEHNKVVAHMESHVTLVDCMFLHTSTKLISRKTKQKNATM